MTPKGVLRSFCSPSSPRHPSLLTPSSPLAEHCWAVIKRRIQRRLNGMDEAAMQHMQRKEKRYRRIVKEVIRRFVLDCDGQRYCEAVFKRMMQVLHGQLV